MNTKKMSRDEIRAAVFKAASVYTYYTDHKAEMERKYQAESTDIADMWYAGRMSFSAIAATSGLSVDAIARKYGIPYGTANNWRAGRKTPSYIRYMLMICEDQI